MERATKVALIAWALAAVAAEAWLLRGWPRLPALTVAAFAGGALLTRVDRRAVGVVLSLVYVFPTLIRAGHGLYHVHYDIIWMSALLGAITPDAIRTPWARAGALEERACLLGVRPCRRRDIGGHAGDRFQLPPAP
jgi:hypothetical protein